MAKGKFYEAVSRKMLVINQASAGAGITGLLGFGGFLLVATMFFVIENYFLSLLLISFGLLFYVSGSDVYKVANAVLTIFFSNKHLVQKAVYLQDTMVALTQILNLRRNSKGEVVADPLSENAKITLPDNPLTQDLKRIFESGRNKEYANYVAHSYYDECQELYEVAGDNYDFVSQTMPLFGLIGTVLGLISMFDTLGSDIRVEALSPQLALALKTTLYGAIFASFYRILAVRFELRLKALDNDFENLVKAIDVIAAGKPVIEVEK